MDEQLKALQADKSKVLSAAHAKERKAKEDAKAATLTQDVAKELEEAAQQTDLINFRRGAAPRFFCVRDKSGTRKNRSSP